MRRFSSIVGLVLTISLVAVVQASAASKPHTRQARSSPTLKTPGTLSVAADFSVPPNQYMANGKPQGIDPAICDAIGRAINLKVQWTNLAFDSLISGLEANRYDALCTGVFITAAREKVMNMVPYVQWGVTMGVKPGTGGTYSCKPSHGNFLPCFERFSGKTVATESGGFEEQLLEQANTELQKKGKATMHIDAFAQTTDAWQALVNGTAVGSWIDDQQFTYFNAKYGHKYVAAFGHDDPTPLALTTTRSNRGLAEAFVSGLKKIKADGTYAKIMKKWNVEAVPSFTINPRVK